MKINQVLKPTFTTPAGKQAQTVSVEKDLTIAPVWRNRVEYWGWIITVRIDGELINLRFDTLGNYTGKKKHFEPYSSYC